MKTILLACSAGMSTSLLVCKMQQVAKDEKLEVDIYAIPETKIDHEVKRLGSNLKVLFLGPQVKYMLRPIKDKLASKKIFVDLIPMQMYGLIDGRGVINLAKPYL